MFKKVSIKSVLMTAFTVVMVGFGVNANAGVNNQKSADNFKLMLTGQNTMTLSDPGQGRCKLGVIIIDSDDCNNPETMTDACIIIGCLPNDSQDN